MSFLTWFLGNFGFFFGAVFLVYFYLMLRRLTLLYDTLRFVKQPAGEMESLLQEPHPALDFLAPLFSRLTEVAGCSRAATEAVIDAIWSELDCRVSIHFNALNGYINSLILVGFAGTIFGSIGAFNQMFTGLSQGEAASGVFLSAWDNGLATALYTSLGAAAIGGGLLTLLFSRLLMGRAKRLETILSLKISEVLTGREAGNGPAA